MYATKFGFDVTVRANVRPSVRPYRPLKRGGGGGESQGNPYVQPQECLLFLAGFLWKENSVLLVVGRLIYRFQDLIEARREREGQRTRINRHQWQWRIKIANERGRA